MFGSMMMSLLAAIKTGILNFILGTTPLTTQSPGTSSGGSLIMSPDGTSVYETALNTNVLNQFSRNTSTGLLTQLSPSTVSTGTTPRRLAISADGISVYCTNTGDNTVSQFSRDTGTGLLTPLSPATVTTSTSAGTAPQGICISADGTSVYVANQSVSDIQIYTRNTGTGLLTWFATVAAPFQALLYEVVVSSDGLNVYASDINHSSSNVQIYTRNTGTGALTSYGVASANAQANYLAISPDGVSLYVGGNGDMAGFSRNPTTGALSSLGGATTVAGGAISIASDGTSLYRVSANYITEYSRNVSSGFLSILSPSTIAVKTGGNGVGLSISPNGLNAYASSLYNTSSIQIYGRNTTTGALSDLGTGQLLFSPTPSSQTQSLTISPDGKNIYGVYYNTVINVVRNTMTGTLTQGTNLTNITGISSTGGVSVAISPDGLFGYVGDNIYYYIGWYSRNTSTGVLTYISSLSVGASTDASQMIFSPNGDFLYASDYTHHNILQFSRNIITGALTRLADVTISVGIPLQPMAMSPDGTSLYVANYDMLRQYARDPVTGLCTALSPASATAVTYPYAYGCPVVVSPDGKFVYVSGSINGTTYQFSRDNSLGANNGKLTPLSPALFTPVGEFGYSSQSNLLAISPDGKTVYSAYAGGQYGGVWQYGRDLTTGLLSQLVITSFNATCAGSILTVTAMLSGTIQYGQCVVATGIGAGAYITPMGPATTGTGGIGTYNLTATPGTLTSRTMTVYNTNMSVASNTNGLIVSPDNNNVYCCDVSGSMNINMYTRT